MYREAPPPKELAATICAIWHSTESGPALILPDACTDILWIPSRRQLRVAGVMTRAFVTPPSDETIIGVRLQPWASGLFLGVGSASDLQDQHVPLEDINANLHGALRRVSSADELLDAISSHAAKLRVDPRVERVAQSLFSSPGVEIAELAAHVGVCARQLQRLFLAHTGLSPKQVARVARLQRAKMLSASIKQLSTLAAEAGFSDQSHMSRELLQLTGRTASSVLSR